MKRNLFRKFLKKEHRMCVIDNYNDPFLNNNVIIVDWYKYYKYLFEKS